MLRPWKLNLAMNIRRGSRSAVYVQVGYGIVEEIRRGRLAAGDVLPGTRKFAEELGVNRKTIVAAYEELIAQGWLISDKTRGTFVSSELPAVVPAKRSLSRGTAAQASSEPDFRLTGTSPALSVLLPKAGAFLFDDGAPDTRLFPAETMSREYRTALIRAARRNGLGYGDPRGALTLRRALARMLNNDRGLLATPDNICLTRGSQMAIHLAARVLIKPGDAVVLEELSYPPAVETFRAAGARIVTVPLDASGLDIEAFETLCRRHSVKLVYLTPHHQFPTTRVMRPEKRLRLLGLAEQFRFAIVEDDYDHEFHFSHQPLLPLASVAPRKTIYIGSMSKLLTPSIRLGYVVAPALVIERMAGEVLLLDRQGDPATELAIAGLIDSGEVNRHARKSLQIYARRRQLFSSLLRESIGDILPFEEPEGGLAFWIDIDGRLDIEKLDERASREGHPISAAQFLCRVAQLHEPGVAAWICQSQRLGAC